MTAKPGKKLEGGLHVSQLRLCGIEYVNIEYNLQEGLATSSLEHLGVVAGGGLLSDGKTLKGVRLHGAANCSHGTEERELAALDGAGTKAGDDGSRHYEYEWCCFCRG